MTKSGVPVNNVENVNYLWKQNKLKMAFEKVDPGDMMYRYRESGYRIISMMEKKLKWKTNKIYFKNLNKIIRICIVGKSGEKIKI